METVKYIFLIILIGLSFFAGARFCSEDKIEYISDTLFIYDTVIYNMEPEVYYITRDTIVYDTIYEEKFMPVDTAAILKDYYAFHKYTRTMRDSNLLIQITDVISRNQFYDTNVNYRILRPTQIIHNQYYNYNRYLGVTLVTSFKPEFTNINLVYIDRQYQFSLGYMPYHNALMFGVGYNLYELK